MSRPRTMMAIIGAVIIAFVLVMVLSACEPQVKKDPCVPLECVVPTPIGE
jgi:hypothetical protein